MLNGLKNAFRIKELREKILFTIAMLVVYRIGAHVPVPGIPFQGMLGLFSTDNNSVAAGAMALLNLFSGGALSYVSVFSLGIMPYITSSIILQMLQAVVPSLHELAREGEVGQTKITQYSRYLTLALAILNSVGYLFLFKSFGISFNGAGAPEIIFDLMTVGTLTAGAMLIIWIGGSLLAGVHGLLVVLWRRLQWSPTASRLQARLPLRMAAVFSAPSINNTISAVGRREIQRSIPYAGYMAITAIWIVLSDGRPLTI